MKLGTFEYVLGVGSNLGARLDTIRMGLTLLAEEPGVEIDRLSSVYESEPVGPPQPRYLNLAVRVTSPLDADALWERLERIENRLGRERRERWGPRTLDLDILWCSRAVDSKALSVPHPELKRRWFALAPLLEVAPELKPAYGPALAALGGAPSGQPLASMPRAGAGILRRDSGL